MTESPEPTSSFYSSDFDFEEGDADADGVIVNSSAASSDSAFSASCNDSCVDPASRKPNVITKIFEKYKPMRIEYENEDISLGFLFASKAMVQLCFNPFSGALIDRIGKEGREVRYGGSATFIHPRTFPTKQ